MENLSLVRVLTHYNGVVKADIDDIWQLVKEGESGEQVGCVRATVIGNAVVVEKLVAVDAEEHYISWKCITDDRATNPFPGSFVNYINTLRFTKMRSGHSYADWSGELWTDVESQDVMRDLLSDFYEDALGSLEKQIQKAKQPRITHETPNYPKDPATIRSLGATFGFR